MWNQTPKQLELEHDYIQWMFPLNEVSGFNTDAPILTEEDIYKFTSSEKLMNTLAESFKVILKFYGFEIYDSINIMIGFSTDFTERSKIWITPGNHNFLRITRILKCLILLGQTKYAMEFLNVLSLFIT